jgi:hypothetical protein
VNRQQVIGRFFSEDLQAAQSGAGMFAIPIPTPYMTADELTAIRAKLKELFDFWAYQALPEVNTAWEAQANAQAIADILQQRIDNVDAVISQQQTQTGAPVANGSAPVIETDPLTGEPISTKKSWLPIILIGAVAFYFFTKKKRT